MSLPLLLGVLAAAFAVVDGDENRRKVSHARLPKASSDRSGSDGDRQQSAADQGHRKPVAKKASKKTPKVVAENDPSKEPEKPAEPVKD